MAGERRLRAHQALGKTSIDCLVIHISDEQNALLALAENLSRSDLSDFETAQAVNKIKDTFENKTELAKALGISRAKLYKLFAFEELPESIKALLENEPHQISADTAERLKNLKKELDCDEMVFNDCALKAVTQMKLGSLKQSNMCEFIKDQITLINCPNSDTAQITVDKMETAADSNIHKIYIRDGKNIGRVKANGNKLVVELAAQSITDEQERKLMQFLDDLLE